MVLTAEQKRARNAGYQRVWREKREALVHSNPDVIERASPAGGGAVPIAGRGAHCSGRQAADAAMIHLRRSQELAGWAMKVRTGER